MSDSTSTSTQSSKSPDIPGVPLHSTSHDYASAQEQHSSAPTHASLSDGRRTSQGEELPSPVELWKPKYGRRQSWDPEDLKREHVVSQLEGNPQGMGTGFTEKAADQK